MGLIRTTFVPCLIATAASALLVLAPPRETRGNGEPRETVLALKDFHVVERESGPDNYYSLVAGPEPFIHAAYRPPAKTAVLGYQIPESQRRSIAQVRWKWRATELPKGGNECESGRGDSAAVVYVTWRRALKWYSVKYVWSAVGPKGKTCDPKRNLFRAQDTVIVDSGPPLGEWRNIQIDPDAEFRNHFENGDPDASVPDLIGIGIMSDGDQTHSNSSADYGGFAVVSK